MIKARFLKGLLLAAVLLVTACSSLGKNDDERIGVSMSGVNHTNKFIYEYYINGAYGSNLSKNNISGATSCCVVIPQKWRPGLKVEITWNMPDGIVDNLKKKTVEIEPYDKPGQVFVHFFDNDVIRVVSSNIYPEDIDHPVSFPGKQRKFPEPIPGKQGE
ncbi:DUF3304 domain-containing protein [Neisseriaceae bacterium TC5R-5]|nr:DUF3304 domain-containing protein [Neisseriaceae bacterium TC5R-5]